MMNKYITIENEVLKKINVQDHDHDEEHTHAHEHDNKNENCCGDCANKGSCRNLTAKIVDIKEAINNK